MLGCAGVWEGRGGYGRGEEDRGKLPRRLHRYIHHCACMQHGACGEVCISTSEPSVSVEQAQGSQDGKPKSKVIVADSGELPIGTS